MGSEESALGEGNGFPFADHEMVDKAHVDERERFGEAFGDGALGDAGFRNAQGVLGCPVPSAAWTYRLSDKRS